MRPTWAGLRAALGAGEPDPVRAARMEQRHAQERAELAERFRVERAALEAAELAEDCRRTLPTPPPIEAESGLERLREAARRLEEGLTRPIYLTDGTVTSGAEIIAWRAANLADEDSEFVTWTPPPYETGGGSDAMVVTFEKDEIPGPAPERHTEQPRTYWRIDQAVLDTGVYSPDDGGRHRVNTLAEANLIGSERECGCHSPVLDIDLSAQLVPSSTPGHFHLYLDGVSMPWEKYEALLLALAEAGVIEQGYARVSIERGGSFVRKPGVRKPEADPVLDGVTCVNPNCGCHRIAAQIAAQRAGEVAW